MWNPERIEKIAVDLEKIEPEKIADPLACIKHKRLQQLHAQTIIVLGQTIKSGNL